MGGQGAQSPSPERTRGSATGSRLGETRVSQLLGRREVVGIGAVRPTPGVAVVGIDSQALTYLVEAIEPGYDPAADDPVVAAERVAMVRSYLYGDVRFWVMPTVAAEYNEIRSPDRHLRHERATRMLLHDALIKAPGDAIDVRASEFQPFHSGIADCRVVAEAEA